MSVQNALKTIGKLRVQKGENFRGKCTLEDILDQAKKEGAECSIDDLRKAFQIDWDLRWLKYSK